MTSTGICYAVDKNKKQLSGFENVDNNKNAHVNMMESFCLELLSLEYQYYGGLQ